MKLSGNVIRSTDSTSISINDSLSITGNLSVPSTNEISFGSLLKIDTQSSFTITSTGAGACFTS